jgi:hypothetical protein
LYVDCAPDRTCQDFAEYAMPVLEALKAQYGAHYRLVDGTYGGNAALFSEAMADHLEINPPKHGLLVTISSPAVRDCLDVLQAQAATIVRAFRG